MRLKYLLLLLVGGMLQAASSGLYVEELTRPRTLLEVSDLRGALTHFAAFEKTALEHTATADNANRELVLYFGGRAAKPTQAVSLAHKAAERMVDVRTQDALAVRVGLFENGERAEARKLRKMVLDVGNQNPKILAHAAMMGVKGE